MIQFPETWNSQTRPLDPDASTCKRKRRTKTKTSVAEITCVEPGPPTENASVCVPTEHDNDAKKTCYQTNLHDAPITGMTESLLKQKIEFQKSQVHNNDMDKNTEDTGTKNSKPCMDRMRCIAHHKVKKVYFTSISSCSK